MNTRKFSLYIAGLVWALVGLRIGMRAVNWLSPYIDPPSWQLIFIVLSVIVGVFKAKKVLSKSVKRGIENSDSLDDRPLNYLIGWIKLYGPRGVIIVLLMIGLGFFLRALRSMGFDSYNVFGFLYLAVSFGLIMASTFYFKAAAELKD